MEPKKSTKELQSGSVRSIKIICFLTIIDWLKILAQRCHHCVKSVQIRRFFWSVISRIRTEYGVSLRIQSKYEKIQTRKNSVFGHFLRSASSGNLCKLFYTRVPLWPNEICTREYLTEKVSWFMGHFFTTMIVILSLDKTSKFHSPSQKLYSKFCSNVKHCLIYWKSV